jgi:hypothetical protein
MQSLIIYHEHQWHEYVWDMASGAGKRGLSRKRCLLPEILDFKSRFNLDPLQVDVVFC